LPGTVTSGGHAGLDPLPTGVAAGANRAVAVFSSDKSLRYRLEEWKVSNYTRGRKQFTRQRSWISMPKALCFFGIAVAVLLLLLFGLDLAMEIPFGRESIAMDVGFILCAGALGYISWSTLREQI
jgi:hypothetical protein